MHAEAAAVSPKRGGRVTQRTLAKEIDVTFPRIPEAAALLHAIASDVRASHAVALDDLVTIERVARQIVWSEPAIGAALERWVETARSGRAWVAHYAVLELERLASAIADQRRGPL